MNDKKRVHIFGGGTISHVSSHFALAAPAYGDTIADIQECINFLGVFKGMEICHEVTKMVRFPSENHSDRVMVTNEDVEARIKELKKDPRTKVIFFSCALVDYEPVSLEGCKLADNGEVEQTLITGDFGKYNQRLDTREQELVNVMMVPTKKIINTIRDGRKDIFLVGFKTTCGATKQEMFEKGLNLCKSSSVNLVLVNDVKTRWNMIVTPEEAAYAETNDRLIAIENLVDMAYWRSQLTFTQSTVVDGKPVPWDSELVPASLRTVVDYCVAKNAYKPFKDATVGHFAVKLSDTEFLTSIRRSNFNKLNETGLVKVVTDGPDTVLAYGAKPSVGGQSQRIVFKDHPGMDCIVHFHCPMRFRHPDLIPTRSQREVECGSHQCGKNTSNGLAQFGNLKAVYLEQHGPNIVFNHAIDPQEVIDFIERNFDLSMKTGGYHL